MAAHLDRHGQAFPELCNQRSRSWRLAQARELIAFVDLRFFRTAVPVLDNRRALGKIVTQTHGRTDSRRTIERADFFAA